MVKPQSIATHGDRTRKEIIESLEWVAYEWSNLCLSCFLVLISAYLPEFFYIECGILGMLMFFLLLWWILLIRMEHLKLLKETSFIQPATDATLHLLVQTGDFKLKRWLQMWNKLGTGGMQCPSVHQ